MPIIATDLHQGMPIANPASMRVIAASSSRAPVQSGQPRGPARRQTSRSSSTSAHDRRACSCAAWSGRGGSNGGAAATPLTAVLLSAVQMLAALQLVSLQIII